MAQFLQLFLISRRLGAILRLAFIFYILFYIFFAGGLHVHPDPRRHGDQPRFIRDAPMVLIDGEKTVAAIGSPSIPRRPAGAEVNRRTPAAAM